MNRQKLNPFFVFVLIYLFDVGLTVRLNSDYFYKVAKSNSIMQYSRKAFEATSPLDCARKCQLQKCASFSFSNHVCSIGQCNSTNATLGLSQEIYVSCFSSDGFTFIPFGSVSACVWVSTNITDYITARDDCRSKDGHLYTLKTMDKLKWLQTYYNRTKIWIGLNDIDVEGTYRWEDDYTVCSQSWMKQIFAPGEPNNRKSSPNGEDCIHFYQNVPLLNDANCLTNYTYICEKPFFNLH